MFFRETTIEILENSMEVYLVSSLLNQTFITEKEVKNTKTEQDVTFAISPFTKRLWTGKSWNIYQLFAARTWVWHNFCLKYLEFVNMSIINNSYLEMLALDPLEIIDLYFCRKDEVKLEPSQISRVNILANKLTCKAVIFLEKIKHGCLNSS